MSVGDFMQPITNVMRSHFLTGRAAARHMLKQGAGVILAFGGSGGGTVIPNLGGFQVALEALEGFRRQLACEVGPSWSTAPLCRSPVTGPGARRR